MQGMRHAGIVRPVVALMAAGVLLLVGSAAASAKIVRTKEAFTITYASGFITSEGEVKCTGYHETNSEKFPGNATEGGRDRETCVNTDAGTFTALHGGEEGHTFPGDPIGYESDWFYVKGININSTKVLYKVNKKDTKFKLLVYVPLEGKYPPIAEPL